MFDNLKYGSLSGNELSKVIIAGQAKLHREHDIKTTFNNVIVHLSCVFRISHTCVLRRFDCLCICFELKYNVNS